MAQITRIRVRETVPDSIIDRADDIEIIDLTPGDLIKRLNEGKVYRAEDRQARDRELFLARQSDGAAGTGAAPHRAARRRAARSRHMQAHAIPGPWAAGDRVLVCIDEHPRSPRWSATRRRLAERLRAPWTAVNVETPRSARLSEAERDRIAERCALPRRLAPRRMTLPGASVAEEIMRYRARATMSRTSSSASPTSRAGARWLEGSVAHDLIRIAGDISVHVVSGQREGAESNANGSAQAADARSLQSTPYLASTARSARSRWAAALLLHRFLDVENIGIVFLMAVLTSALWYGLGRRIFASRRQRAGVQFLLPAAALHLHDRRPGKRRRASSSSSSSPSSPAI